MLYFTVWDRMWAENGQGSRLPFLSDPPEGEDVGNCVWITEGSRGVFRDSYTLFLELPSLEGEADARQAVEAVRGWGLEPLRVEPLGPSKHIFTHVEWHMTGYTLEVAGDGPADFVWAGAEELGERAVPSAFARYSDEAMRRLGGWKED